jgi:hypothetical protein
MFIGKRLQELKFNTISIGCFYHGQAGFIPLAVYLAKTPSPLPYPRMGTRAHGVQRYIAEWVGRIQEEKFHRTRI